MANYTDVEKNKEEKNKKEFQKKDVYYNEEQQERVIEKKPVGGESIVPKSLQIDIDLITTPMIADDAVTKAKINADVAGNGLGQNADGSLEVNVDGTSIEIIADILKAKASGIDHSLLSNLNTTNYTHLTSANATDLTDGGATTLHKHDHGGMDGLSDDDHTQYVLANGTRDITGDQEFKGDIIQDVDNKKIVQGTGKDIEHYYDGTNYKTNTDVVTPSDWEIDCGTDKTIELVETVWQDINLAGAILSLPTSSHPAETQFVDEAGNNTGIYTYGFGVNDKVSGNFELQHDYKEGTDLHFHLHFQGSVAPTGTDNIKFELTYTVGRSDETLDAATVISKECPYDTRYEFVRCDFTAITGTNFKIGDQILFTVKRIAASADEYAGNAIVATMGVHYEIDTIGSRQIGTK